MRASFELVAKSSLEELSRISDFILASARESSFDERETFHLMTAVDEACTNIIKYSSSEEIEIRCELKGDRVLVEIRDDGIAFNPLDALKPDLSPPLEEREVGGLGIYFIRTLMNDVKYERRDGKNVLTMTLRHRNHIL